MILGDHEIHVPVTFANTAAIDVDASTSLTFKDDVTLSAIAPATSADVSANVVGTLVFDSPLNVGANTLTKSGAGTMSVNNAVASSGGGGVVGAAGTIAGIGTIGGDLTINAGATVAPGNSIGTLSVADDATVSGPLASEVQGNGGSLVSDELAVTGALTMTGAAVALNWLPTAFDAGDPDLDTRAEVEAAMFGGTYSLATYVAAGLTGMPTLSLGNIGPDYVDDTLGDLNDTGTALQVTLNALGAGDATVDALVNLADLNLVGTMWDTTGTKRTNNWLTGDVNSDGLVNLADLNEVGTNWATTSLYPAGSAGAGTNPVPEPGTIVMLLIGAAGLLLYRKRR